MAIDMAQMGAYRAQMAQIEFNQKAAQAQIMTQQTALALDAAKFIIGLERDEETDVAFFTDEQIGQAYDTVALIAKVFRPQVTEAPPPE